MILKYLALCLTQFPFLSSMRCDGGRERKATLHHIKYPTWINTLASMNHTKSEEQCWPIGAMKSLSPQG